MVETCIHFANFLYLFSYLVRDMFWLRILTCGGLVLGLVFFYCQPLPLYGPSVWHVIFLVINLFQIRSLLIQRRRQSLTRMQRQFGEAAFHDLSREEILTLLTHVTCQSHASLSDIQAISHQRLNRDERVLRDLAFSSLSRKELMNLLTRRMWNSLRRRGKPGPWNHRPSRGPVAVEPEHDVMVGPLTG